MDRKIKKDFPVLASSNLIYFDNAATTHKPQEVIDAISHFYATSYATVHRGIYTMSEQATEQFEKTRALVAEFIGANTEEIVFTQGTTHGINFIATAWGGTVLKPGDEIVITELEHHSNLIPWQQIAQRTGALLKYIPINRDGTLNLDTVSSIITQKTKLVAAVHSSNVLGTYNDIGVLRRHARNVGAKILIDAAQSVVHQPLNMQELDVDFLVFSGHKLLGPTGIGILYIAKKVFHEVPPYQFGGGMVYSATYDTAQWRKPPYCYEAGTPPIAEVIGLGAALSYIQKNINFSELKKHEAQLCSRAIEKLQAIPQVTLLGPLEQLKKNGHLITFTIKGWHPHDVGAYLNNHAVAIRAGHFCAQPLAYKLNIAQGACRLSFYAYNSVEEVDYCMDLLEKLVQ